MAQVAMTKQAAAHRLIASAIRMVSEDMDPVASHVVAASALNLLRELLEEREYGIGDNLLRAGLYHTAMERLAGRPLDLPEGAQIDEVLDGICQAIQEGKVNGPEDIGLNANVCDRTLLDAHYKPFNFLKHARRDPLATLDEADVKPRDALTYAIAAYVMVFPGNVTPEEFQAFLVAERALAK